MTGNPLSTPHRFPNSCKHRLARAQMDSFMLAKRPILGSSLIRSPAKFSRSSAQRKSSRCVPRKRGARQDFVNSVCRFLIRSTHGVLWMLTFVFSPLRLYSAIFIGRSEYSVSMFKEDSLEKHMRVCKGNLLRVRALLPCPFCVKPARTFNSDVSLQVGHLFY